MYLIQTTPAQARQNDRDGLVLESAEALHHFVSVMVSVNQKFYAVPPEQLVADLNADIENSIAIMSANATLGAVANAHLDTLALDKYSKRIPLTISDPTISFNGSEFVYSEPVVVEPLTDEELDNDQPY